MFGAGANTGASSGSPLVQITRQLVRPQSLRTDDLACRCCPSMRIEGKMATSCVALCLGGGMGIWKSGVSKAGLAIPGGVEHGEGGFSLNDDT